MLLAVLAGWTDYRSRRIPNWLTVPGLAIGVGINVTAEGWAGLRTSLLGAGLGLLIAKGLTNYIGAIVATLYGSSSR